jgi:uncharacterized protein (UPF0333 family)
MNYLLLLLVVLAAVGIAIYYNVGGVKNMIPGLKGGPIDTYYPVQ